MPHNLRPPWRQPLIAPPDDALSPDAMISLLDISMLFSGFFFDMADRHDALPSRRFTLPSGRLDARRREWAGWRFPLVAGKIYRPIITPYYRSTKHRAAAMFSVADG